MTRAAPTLVLAAVLVACAPPPPAVSPTAALGVVAGSTSHDAGPGTERAYAGYRFESADGARTWTVTSREALFAEAVPAGDYRLASWWLNTGGGLTVSPRSAAPIAFRVRAGETVYIGNLHMTIRTGENLLGSAVAAGGWPRVVDESARDLPAIAVAYPSLGPVTVAVLDDSAWTRE